MSLVLASTKYFYTVFSDGDTSKLCKANDCREKSRVESSYSQWGTLISKYKECIKCLKPIIKGVINNIFLHFYKMSKNLTYPLFCLELFTRNNKNQVFVLHEGGCKPFWKISSMIQCYLKVQVINQAENCNKQHLMLVISFFSIVWFYWFTDSIQIRCTRWFR